MDSKEQRSGLRAAVYRGDGRAVFDLLRGVGSDDDSRQLAGDGLIAAVMQGVDGAAELGTLLFGTMAVTRAVLPTMRAQRAGTIVSISSTAGIVGQQFCSAYAAAKFGVEGWMESLATEVEQFGISTTIVEPGFFRTDLLTPESTTWAELSIDDYAEQSAATNAAWQSMNGKQGGDPAKLAAALVSVIDTDKASRPVGGRRRRRAGR